MLSSGLTASSSSNMNSLLDVLSDSKKSAETLKKLKAEQAKLTKLKKEVLEGKTLAAYRKKVEKEVQELIQDKVQRLQDIEEEEVGIQASITKQNKEMLDLKKALSLKEKNILMKEKEIKELQVLAEMLEAKAIKAQEKADKELAYAQSLKIEYTEKLNDIKERLRGL